MPIRYLVSFVLLAACSAMPDCHLRELDICAGSLAVFARPMQVGEDGDYGDELDYRCEMVDDVFDCVGNYTNDCLSEMHVELYNHVIRGVKKMKQSLCSPDSQIREEYMRHIPCIQTQMRQSDRPCLNDAKVGLEAIINSKWIRRNDMIMCVVNRYRNCYYGQIEEMCGLDAVVFLQKVSRVMFSRFPEYFFAEAVPGSKMCRDMPPEGSRMTGVKSRFKLLSHIMTYLKSQE